MDGETAIAPQTSGRGGGGGANGPCGGVSQSALPVTRMQDCFCCSCRWMTGSSESDWADAAVTDSGARNAEASIAAANFNLVRPDLWLAGESFTFVSPIKAGAVLPRSHSQTDRTSFFRVTDTVRVRGKTPCGRAMPGQAWFSARLNIKDT